MLEELPRSERDKKAAAYIARTKELRFGHASGRRRSAAPVGVRKVVQAYFRSRQNILISGGTGSGKTTLLTALAKFIADQDRTLLIEDTSEIQLEKPNLVRFEARQAQADLPAISIRDLLKASLRHRPDRVILGEIRGGEAFDLLQLLDTGHSGTLSTVHASSAAQALARAHKLCSSERNRTPLPCN